jgi:asparagine synthetase B (glutamine-hydrolysing)
MCGISGFLIAGASLPIRELEARLWTMIATLRHREPDDEGVWTDRQAGLAHARLSIIDLSPAGHQPIVSADGTAWITYNGEIYNFAEIRQELEALGYPFRSRSDTEVIVNGWQAWGPKIFSRLRGMFALGIWDRRSRQLILARDRLGKKPLYYAPSATAFLFGSEIKAVLAWPGLSREADLSAIDSYLTFEYMAAPQTAFDGIRKLPAAHWARRHRRAAELRREPCRTARRGGAAAADIGRAAGCLSVRRRRLFCGRRDNGARRGRNETAQVTLNALEVMSVVNPMLQDTGKIDLGLYTVSWKSAATTPVADGVGYPVGVSLYQLALYKTSQKYLRFSD